jgi:hypothetical protein
MFNSLSKKETPSAMKPIHLLSIVGLILSSSVDAKEIEGKIFFEHDTIDVVFDIPIKFLNGEPNYERLQYRVNYFDSTGRKTRLGPDQAKEIRFRHGNEYVRMLSIYNSIGFRHVLYPNKNIFLQLKVDGSVKLFSYYYTENTDVYDESSGIYYSEKEFILQRADGELKRPKVFGFKNDMIDYFRDCPALAEKIEAKHFRKSDLELIASWYNEHCR